MRCMASAVLSGCETGYTDKRSPCPHLPLLSCSQAGSASGGDEIEQLTQQHESYAEQVQQIRQELELVLGAGQS